MANGLALLFDPAVQAALPAICEKYGIARLEAFGSVVREDFGPESDIDLLFTAGKDRFVSLRDLFYLKEELALIFRRPVDMVDHEALLNHYNWILRQNMLSRTEPIYDTTQVTV